MIEKHLDMELDKPFVNDSSATSSKYFLEPLKAKSISNVCFVKYVLRTHSPS
jgi:hypothetical protein